MRWVIPFLFSWMAVSAQTEEKRSEATAATEAARRLQERGTAVSLREAILKAREAVAAWQEVGDKTKEVECLNLLGRAHKSLREFPEAIEAFEQALRVARSIHDRLGEGQAQAALGMVSNDKGDNQRALQSYEEALALFRSVGNTVEEGQTLNNIALAYSQLGNQRRAMEHYEQALAIARTAKNRRLESIVLLNLGVERGRAGDLESALELYGRALPIYRELGYGRGEADSLTNMGNIYSELGESEKALGYLGQALTVRRKIGDRRGEAIALGNMGEVQRDLGYPLKAIGYHQDSLAIRRSIADVRGEAVQLGYLGRDYEELRQPEKAKEQHERALEIARSIGDHRLEGRAQLSLGRIRASLGQTEAALECFRDARRLLEPAGDKAGQAAAFFEIARVLGGQGRTEEALRELDSALALQEEIRRKSPANELRASFFGVVREQFEYKVELLMRQGRHAEAFEASERARARSLLDMLSGGREPEPLTLRQVQQEVLDGDTVLLQYLVGKTRSFLWAVDRETCRAVTLPGREELEAAARRAHASLSAGGGTAGLAALGKMLLPPAAGVLGRKRLLVASDGALQYIPFAALPGVIDAHEVVTLPSVSSVAALRATLAGRPRAPNAVLILADPVFDGSDPRVGGSEAGTTVVAPELERSVRDTGLAGLYRLRSTRKEAEEITAIVGGKGLRKALDFDANRRVATGGEMAGYRVIHFATHGLLDSAHPERSGIVLTLVDRKGRPQDGFLRVPDIYGLQLKADLVVLSACQTALGKEVRGEGLIGLTRGFMFAGAPRVVSSLWRVPDRATAELMKRFYQNMFQKEMRPAEALRQAQRSMQGEARWSTPSNWAGFVLQGEWR